MKHFSQHQFFRDMHKNPDMYPLDYEEKSKNAEMVREYEAEKAKENHGKNHENELQKSLELKTSAGVAFLSSVNLINDAKGPDALSFPKEAEIFSKRKEMTLNYLHRILEDAENYLTQVNALQLIRMASYDDVAKYQEAVNSGDSLRSALHNKLISDIKIAMKLVNLTFNEAFPMEVRLKMESKMPERNGMSQEELQNILSQQKYSQFPFSVGGFIDFSRSPRDPQGEREYMASWALTLYSDLASLSGELRKILDNKKPPL